MSFKRLLGFGLSLSIVFSILPLQVVADEISDQYKFRSLEGESYTVQESITSTWDGHANLEFVFTNTGDETINDWYYTFDFGYEIENPYNCYILEHEGNLYTIGNNDWNQDIKPGESVTIGFTAASADGSAVEAMPSFYLLNTKTIELPADAASLEYTEYSNWTDGFSGALTLNNNTDIAIRDWSITFSANRPITESYGSILTVNDDGTYMITNDGNSQNITTYGSFQIGFNGGNNDPAIPFEISDLSVTAHTYGLSISEDNDDNGVPDVCEADYSGTIVVTPTPTPTNTPTVTEIPTITDEPIPTTTDAPTATPTVEIPTDSPTATPTAVPTGSAYYLTDSDNDMLPDDYEDFYGTDKDDSDTDDDGVIDGYEILLGTDPLNPDSDGDGVLDGEEDYDGDGLTDTEESVYGTNPMLADSDLDGLTDYEEIYTYFTSPNKYDTDVDGISDYKEVQIGSDPLVFDSNVKRTQTLTVNIDNEEHPSGVESVSVKCYMDGCILDNTTITDIYGIDEQSSSIKALIGVPVEIESNAAFSSATITFKYSDDVDESNLKIMWYDEENYQYVVLDNSVVNTTDNTVSVQTAHFSKYMLIDMSVWVNTWVGTCMYAENYFYIPSGEMDPSEYLSWILEREVDSDGDGLPNCMETGGMLNNCGQLIFTDPYNSDTDGDGISDRIEMGELKDLLDVVPYSYIQEYATILPYSAKQHPYFFYCFLQKSSPNKANDDSSIETKTGLLNDGIETIELGGDSYYWNQRDEGYIHITDYPDDIFINSAIYDNDSYGGHQNWFAVVQDSSDTFDASDVLNLMPLLDIQREGCGLIAVTDVTMYLENGDKTVDFKDYKSIIYGSYIDYCVSDYFAGKIGLPLLPSAIVRSLNSYKGYITTDYTITPVYGDRDILLEKIKSSIIDGKPVIILITDLDFKSLSDYEYNGKSYVDLYSLDSALVDDSVTDFSNSLVKLKNGTNYHYVTVTGILFDSNTGKTYLRIQTWGIERYIDYDNFYDKCQMSVEYDLTNLVGRLDVSCVIYAE